MSAEHPQAPYMIVVKTNQYTGNFERELCAYATGGLGECSVGEEASAVYFEEVTDEDLHMEGWLRHEADDHGCHRPVSIWNHEGKKYEELAIFLDELPPLPVLSIMASRIRAYPQYAFDHAPSYAKQKKLTLKILGITIVKREIKLTETVVGKL